MTWLRDAVDEGVKAGFAVALAEKCDGRQEPEDRCPISPKDGCACYFVAYRNAPWWRKIFMDEPKCPSPEVSLRALVTCAVERAMEDRT